MDREPIGQKRKGDKIKIVAKKDAEGFPGAKWLKFDRPIGNHFESWVLSGNGERKIMVKDGKKDATWSVVLYPPKNEKPEKFMSRAHSILRMVIATDVNGVGCNWNSRGWDQYEKQFMDTCLQGMKRYGRGLIMRNCTRIECETVAARLACQRLVTSVIRSNSIDHHHRIE